MPSYDIVIVGGGTGGICSAARLRKADSSLRIAVIDPATKHYYQPLWTLVGGGAFKKEVTERSEADVMPKGVEWIQKKAVGFEPEAHQVLLEGGESVEYQQLIVAAGIQINWGGIEGLEGNVGRNGLCSNYSYETVDSTWEAIRNFQGGTAIFTQPSTPIKCGGAPQKICYLAEDAFVRAGVREGAKVLFRSGLGSIFAVAKYAASLEKVIERKRIDAKYQQELVAVDADAKVATFKDLSTGETEQIEYEMMHVTPPMSAPDFIAQSPLANEAGWVDVNKDTLQHARYPDVFALGDCSSLPTSKTGAAIRKQAPVLVQSLLAHRRQQSSSATYDGYTSCPLVTGYGSLILAEFDYRNEPAETFPFDQSKERWSMYQLKAHLLPALYWHGMLKGRA